MNDYCNEPEDQIYYENVECVEEDSVLDIYDPRMKFSESVVIAEQETFKHMNSFDHRQHFNKTKSQIESSNGNICKICKQRFGLMLKQYLCQFCQESVCGNHSRKRRKSNVDGAFNKICDDCEVEILFEIITSDFEREREQCEQQLQDIELLSQEIIVDVKLKEEKLIHKNKNVRYLQEKIDTIQEEQQQLLSIEQIICDVTENIRVKKDQQIQIMNEISIMQLKIQSKQNMLEIKYYFDLKIRDEQQVNIDKSLIEIDTKTISLNDSIRDINDIILEEQKKLNLRKQIETETLNYRNFTISIIQNQSNIGFDLNIINLDITDVVTENQKDLNQNDKLDQIQKKEQVCTACQLF